MRIEILFGILCALFPGLRVGLNVEPANAELLVSAALTLHNIVRLLGKHDTVIGDDVERLGWGSMVLSKFVKYDAIGWLS